MDDVPLKAVNGKFPDRVLIVSNVNERAVYDVGEFDYFTLQVLKDGDTDVTSMVLKVQKSNAGYSSVDFASPVTQSVEGMTAKQDVTAVGFVHAIITTAGTSGKIRLFARAQIAR